MVVMSTLNAQELLPFTTQAHTRSRPARFSSWLLPQQDLLKKWYHRIFFHLVDMSVVNAEILWHKRNPKTPCEIQASCC